MIDYSNKYRLKVLILKILDLLFWFGEKKTIYSSFSLESNDEPKMVILQTTFDVIGKYNWILCGIVESNFMNCINNYYIVYKTVGYFEYKFYNKISKDRTLNYLKELRDFVYEFKKKNEHNKNNDLSEFKNLKINKSKNLKKIFGEEE